MKDYTKLTPTQRLLVLSVKRHTPEPRPFRRPWTDYAASIVVLAAWGVLIFNVVRFLWGRL